MSYRVLIHKKIAIPEVAKKYGKTVEELETMWGEAENIGLTCAFIMDGDPPSDLDRVEKAEKRRKQAK